MLNWIWVRIKAMHWAAKLFSAAFLLHAGVYLVQAYQLKHLQVPPFSELRKVEGKLILVKQGREWLTGVEKPDGSKELFTCQLPGVGGNKLCFMDIVINKYKLDTKPDVIIWWYPMTAPLEDKIYPYIFQVQLGSEQTPLGLGTRLDFSYDAKITGFQVLSSEGPRGKVGMSLLYVFGVVLLVVWESFKYSTRKG